MFRTAAQASPSCCCCWCTHSPREQTRILRTRKSFCLLLIIIVYIIKVIIIMRVPTRVYKYGFNIYIYVYGVCVCVYIVPKSFETSVDFFVFFSQTVYYRTYLYDRFKIFFFFFNLSAHEIQPNPYCLSSSATIPSSNLSPCAYPVFF